MSDRVPPVNRFLLPTAVTMTALLGLLVVGTLFSDGSRETGPSPTAEAPAAASPTVLPAEQDTPRVSAKDATPLEPICGAATGVGHVPSAEAGAFVVAPAAMLADVPQPSVAERPRPVQSSEDLMAELNEVATIEIFSAPGETDQDEGKRRFRRMRNRIANASGRPGYALPNPLRGPMWRGSRVDLDGIPLAEGDDCQLSEDESVELKRVSTEVGTLAARAGTFAGSNQTRSANGIWYDVHALVERDSADYDPSGLHQILQIAPVPTRRVLVSKLSENESAEATKALVQRALFDLDAEIRGEAVAALATRPDLEYTNDLLEAFDHPWLPVAEHAADALIGLGRTDVVDSLRWIARKPDPRAPFRDEGGRWFTREMVRANHMRNCLLCHAPNRVPFQLPTGTQSTEVSATAPSEQRPEGIVPDPYAPLPRVYYSSSNGGGSLFVRADITYVWQDFSVVMDDPRLGSTWPDQQRFDFFVRKRNVSDVEADRLAERFPQEQSPHRRVARYALAALSGS